MDLFGPGEMTSTHSGNPICAAAALANLAVIREQNIVENARDVGELLQQQLSEIRNQFSDVIGAHHGRGLVGGLHVVEPGSEIPDGQLAMRTVRRAVEKGLMLFAPVGFGGATIKVCPPLVISKDAILEGAEVLRESIEAALEPE